MEMTDERGSPNLGLICRPSDFGLKSIGMPKIMKPGASKEWLVWFHGRTIEQSQESLVNLSTGNVYFCVSKDGISDWTLQEDNPVLQPGKTSGDWWWFDSEHVGIGDVINPGISAQSKFIAQQGLFIAYFFGGNSDSVTIDIDQNDGTQKRTKEIKGVKMEIGVAVSQDGVHWSKVEGDGAYSSILEVGGPGEFDNQFVGWPHVMEDENSPASKRFKMYYHTYNPVTKKFVIGLALSKDGIRWGKVGPVFDGGGPGTFDELGASRRFVVKTEEGHYKMWYEGVSRNGIHSIGLALSTDGIKWHRSGNEPIFQPRSEDDDAWDSGGVGSPHMVWIDAEEKWRLYYVGTKKKKNPNAELETGIGVAESDDEKGLNFTRIPLVSSPNSGIWKSWVV